MEAQLLPALSPAFDQASSSVVEYLSAVVPLASWSVARYDGERQVHLTVGGTHPSLCAGTTVPWDKTMCQYVLAGRTPEVTLDAMSVPVYAAVARAHRVDIGTYVGIPIVLSSGRVFGTLCGFDQRPDALDVGASMPLVRLLGAMLAQVLEADLERTSARAATVAAESLAESDALTGLLNRRGWDRMVALEQDRDDRYGDPSSVIVLDLDGLKATNDTEGHHRGDELLHAASSTLVTVARSSDVIARLGGDEFGLLAGRTTDQQAAVLVDRIREQFERRAIACSVGWASSRESGGVQGAWRDADRAMYMVKENRRLGVAS